MENLTEFLDKLDSNNYEFDEVEILLDFRAAQISCDKLLELRKRAQEDNDGYGNTCAGRTSATQSVIDALNPEYALEVGLGAGAPTYYELMGQAYMHGYGFAGIEIDPLFITNGCQEVMIGDILCPSESMEKLLKAVDMVRCANTAVPYFMAHGEFGHFLNVMQQCLSKGSKLIVSYSPAHYGFGEEAFLYEKKEDALVLDRFMFSMWHDGFKTMWGGNEKFSVLQDNFDEEIITKPLLNQGYELVMCHEKVYAMYQDTGALSTQSYWTPNRPDYEAMEIVVDSIAESELIGGMVSMPINNLQERLNY